MRRRQQACVAAANIKRLFAYQHFFYAQMAAATGALGTCNLDGSEAIASTLLSCRRSTTAFETASTWPRPSSGDAAERVYSARNCRRPRLGVERIGGGANLRLLGTYRAMRALKRALPCASASIIPFRWFTGDFVPEPTGTRSSRVGEEQPRPLSRGFAHSQESDSPSCCSYANAWGSAARTSAGRAWPRRGSSFETFQLLDLTNIRLAPAICAIRSITSVACRIR